MHDVEVNVQNNRHIRLLANGSNCFEQAFGRGAAGQAPLGGKLIDQAVGQWIAEGDAKLEDIHAGIRQPHGKRFGRCEIGIARAYVGHKSLAVLFA